MGKIRSTTRVEVTEWQAYPLPAPVEVDLANWGRWASGHSGGAARSVNPLFREAVRGFRWATLPSAPSDLVDVCAAQRVESTICAHSFSPFFRQILALHYVRSAPQALICQLLHLPWRQFQQRLQAAGLYFWERHQGRAERGA